mgnify:CR=1 FL=1
MVKKQKSGGGTRKYDRNKVWCQAYRARGQREKNKAVRLRKHIVRHPADHCAVDALSRVAPAMARKLAA